MSSYNLIMMCFDCEDYRLVHGGFHTVDEAVLSDSLFGVDEICQCANDAANVNSDRTWHSGWVSWMDANIIWSFSNESKTTKIMKTKIRPFSMCMFESATKLYDLVIFLLGTSSGKAPTSATVLSFLFLFGCLYAKVQDLYIYSYRIK